MQFTLTKRPSIVKGRTKNEVLPKLRLSGYMSSNHFSGYCDGGVSFRNPKKYTVVNFEKYNKKCKHTIKNGKKQSTVIRNAHWIGYAYSFTSEELEVLNIKLVQQTRNFIISKCK